MESIAYQSRDVIAVMDAEAGVPVKRLRVDGGVSKSDFLMQFQSDILQIIVERPEYTESSALGAAWLAGIGVGFYPDESAHNAQTFTPFLMDRMGVDVFYPGRTAAWGEERYVRWLKAAEKSRGWTNDAI